MMSQMMSQMMSPDDVLDNVYFELEFVGRRWWFIRHDSCQGHLLAVGLCTNRTPRRGRHSTFGRRTQTAKIYDVHLGVHRSYRRGTKNELFKLQGPSANLNFESKTIAQIVRQTKKIKFRLISGPEF